VVGLGREYRRQVDRGDAEVDEVVEVVDDALEVPTEVVVERGRLAPVGGLGGVVLGIPVREAFGEYLVEDGVGDPLRRVDDVLGIEERVLVVVDRAGFTHRGQRRRGVLLEPHSVRHSASSSSCNWNA